MGAPLISRGGSGCMWMRVLDQTSDELISVTSMESNLKQETCDSAQTCRHAGKLAAGGMQRHMAENVQHKREHSVQTKRKENQ